MLMERSIRSADLLDLPVFEFDRRRPAEDGNRYFEPFPLFVHFLYETVEGSERAVGDTNLLADFETDRCLRPLYALLNLVQDTSGLGIGDRDRLVVRSQEPRHFRGVLDQVIGL